MARVAQSEEKTLACAPNRFAVRRNAIEPTKPSIHPLHSGVGKLVPDLSGNDKALACLTAGYRRPLYRSDTHSK